MPELPEVETLRRELLDAGLKGLQIINALVFWERSLVSLSPEEFCAKMKNQVIEGVGRRGKLLIFTLSSYSLIVHLRMTGKISLDREDTQITSHERIRLVLSNGKALRYEDQRKFGKWTLLECPDEKLSAIGLDPTTTQFTVKALQNILAKRKGMLKPFLLSQQFIAGLGNIYVDEALWEAMLHPQRTIDTLTKEEVILLHGAIREVLRRGIENRGTSLGNHLSNYARIQGDRGKNQDALKVFRRQSLACPRCCQTIIKIAVAQRGTHLCPHCQSIGMKTAL